MANPSKAKGTDFEVNQVLPALVAYWPEAERRAQSGSQDRGDFHIPGEKRFIIEAKNRTQLALPKWLREAEVEAKNAGVPYGVVCHKRKGTRVPGEQYVTMTLDTFLGLVADHDVE